MLDGMKRNWVRQLVGALAPNALGSALSMTPENGKNTMNPNEERDHFIAAKLNEGRSLAEVQKLLAGELNINMTYLDLRLLAADLQVDWRKQETKKPVEMPDTPAEETAPTSGPRTKVTVSRLVRPGAAMSGDVTFASGAEAEWYVDSYGRLGLNPKSGSGRPTETDLREFQAELQKKLGGRG